MGDDITVEINGLRDRDDADELVNHLVDTGIKRDAISISE